MHVTILYEGQSLSVYRIRCCAGPADRPFAEVHRQHSLSYVRRGSFGCRTLGEEHELVPGAVMVGLPDREYTATHEHHGRGDECLSIKLAPELAESIDSVWQAPRLPPLPELMVLGELIQAAAEGRAAVSVDEAARMLVARVALLAGERLCATATNGLSRRRAVEAAFWLDENAAEPVGLEAAARNANLSPFHFLRSFRAVTGVTPHQYLLRLRLRRAAKLLSEDGLPITAVALEAGFSDLSNFVRTFRRAAGVSPRSFRRAARGERRIVQERVAALV